MTTPLESLPPLPAIDGNLYVLHFSCGLQEDFGSAPVPFLAIIAQHHFTGNLSDFSAWNLFTRAGAERGDFRAKYPEFEKRLLAEFARFVADRSEARLLHWRFPFDRVSQRACWLGLDPIDVPECRRYDLATHLKVRFGDRYADDPRLWHAIRNNLGGKAGTVPGVLTTQERAEAWRSGAYAILHANTATLASSIGRLFGRVTAGTFITAADLGTGRISDPEPPPCNPTAPPRVRVSNTSTNQDPVTEAGETTPVLDPVPISLGKAPDGREVARLWRAFLFMGAYGTTSDHLLDATDRSEFEEMVGNREWFGAVEQMKPLAITEALASGVMLSDAVLTETAALRVRVGRALPATDRDRLDRLTTELYAAVLRIDAARKSPLQTGNEEGSKDREAKVRAALAALLAVGPNAKKIAELIGVPRTTLLSWPKFKDHYDRVRRDAKSNRQSRRGRLAGANDFSDQGDDE